MMDKKTYFEALKFIPLALGVIILAIGAMFVPWHEVIPYFSRLSALSYGSIFIFGLAYYIAKIVRYHYMLHVLNTPMSFLKTVVAYFAAQPVALLPGGEAYRVVTLNEHGEVPKSKGASIVFIQSFTENIAMIVLALIGAVILKQNVLLIFGLLFLYLLLLVLVRTKHFADKSHSLLNKIPFITFARSKLRTFIGRNKTLLSGKSFIVLITSGFVSSLIASTLLFILANDLNIHIDFTHAVIAFTIPTVLQNISLLPGGIGVNEQGTVGVLLLLGSPLPAAVALTIIMRFVTLVLGVIIGLITQIASKIR